MWGSHEENVENLLYTWSKLSGIWENIEQFINNVFKTIQLNRFSVFAGILINNETDAVVNVISIARFEIWKRRNMVRYESIFIDLLIVVVKYEVKSHFQILATKTCSWYGQIWQTHPYILGVRKGTWDYIMRLLHYCCDRVLLYFSMF